MGPAAPRGSRGQQRVSQQQRGGTLRPNTMTGYDIGRAACSIQEPRCIDSMWAPRPKLYSATMSLKLPSELRICQPFASNQKEVFNHAVEVEHPNLQNLEMLPRPGLQHRPSATLAGGASPNSASWEVASRTAMRSGSKVLRVHH
jgi:hypothetical protein